MSGMLPESLSKRWYNSDAFDPADPWADFSPRRTAVVLVDLVNWQAHRDGFSARVAAGTTKRSGARTSWSRRCRG